MKAEILNYLAEEKKAVSFDNIKEQFNISTVADLQMLTKVLAEMEKEFLIYVTKKNRYILLADSHLKKGRLMVNKKGFGFVVVDNEEDIYISEDKMNGAIHNDIVIVNPIMQRGLRLEGEVLKIVERQLKNVLGDLYFRKNKAFLKLDDAKLKIKVEMDQNKILGAVAGNKVLVAIKKQIKNNYYKGEVIKVLGHVNDPGVDILAVVYKYDLAVDFSPETLSELKKIPLKVLDEEVKNRKDLRDELIFTIDGDDTKDIDDALSLKKLSNNNYLLGVHIADVSYYVKENTALDKDAFLRGTSVYLADRVIPMLPHQLSNGICSLNPDVDRLAITCEMEIDKEGDVVASNIFESVIRSKKQMTYRAVNEILEEDENVTGYENFFDNLKEMRELAKILRRKKIDRGYIDFNIDEAKIIVDENGAAVDVKLRDRKTGEMLIEDFMIAANETVAEMIYHLDLPFVYRVHGKPDDEKVENFLNFIRVLGYNITLPKSHRKFTSKDLQIVLEQLDEKKEHAILSRLLLRSMQKAIYDKENIGHFGLASKCYTHFTSPIRRYPDTLVHRLLREYLFNKNYQGLNKWQQSLVYITEHSSQKERDAIECEREVSDMKKAEYMMNHIGETFTGIISSVMSFGMFIELDKGIEGLIAVDDMEDDFYEFDENTFSLIGRQKKKSYRLGDSVSVVVKRASKEARTIDFILDEKR